MAANSVQPLRIAKSSPRKNHDSVALRALTELSPMERRRNSPSWNQTSKKMISSRESSPFDSSIISPRSALSKFASSPFSENSFDRPESPSLSRRRTSIENLKKASRVKNSSMFAREQAAEYDPTTTIALERPLASGRALNASMQVNPAPTPKSPEVVKTYIPTRGHRRGESQNKIPLMSVRSQELLAAQDRFTKSPSPVPSREQPSPTKSSFSSKRNTLPRSFDMSAQHDSDDDNGKVTPARPLRRQAKSVQFDSGPPQINEYEAATPDPSSVASGSREGSYENFDEDEDDLYDIDRAMTADEDSFDASLEDTQKTPVVLPEDWRAMTPDVADSQLVANFEDPFKVANQQTKPSEEWHKFRTASVNSEIDSRPLPPVPRIHEHGRRHSGNILDRVHNANRALPTLPSAPTVSKADILGMKDHAMSLEDRVRLMAINDAAIERSSPERIIRDAARSRPSTDIQVHEDEDVKQPTALPAFSFPQISREAILRKVRSNAEIKVEEPFQYDVETLDPDVPIQSTETSHIDEVHIKQEEDEADAFKLYSIPALQAVDFSFDMDIDSRDGSVVRHDIRSESESMYSAGDGAHSSSNDEDEPATPRQDAVNGTKTFEDVKTVDELNVTEFSMLDDSEIHADLHSYLANGEEDPQKLEMPQESTIASPEREMKTPELQVEDESMPGSPQSVVHHPIAASPEPEEEPSPEIPIRHATIKAPGGKLKARPSLTPADAQTMAATRRQVSGSHVPAIMEPSGAAEPAEGAEESDVAEKIVIARAVAEHKKRRESFMPSLDLPGDNLGEDMSLDLESEFDRVIETSKKGYLMRQNTKVVIAKRDFSNEHHAAEVERPVSADDATQIHTSARKPSHERAKSWTTEPWNGKSRRKSLRSVDRKALAGPTPPMPGQESALAALDTVAEDSTQQDGEGEGIERGRLFVKVVGIKSLDLPMPKERTWFQLTLDNGMHCVTTSRLELGRSAPIGQEFELIVLNDLEFQLTLQTELKRPVEKLIPHPSPQKNKPAVKKTSALSRFLGSPKKRREQERLQQEQEAAERKAHQRKLQDAARRPQTPPSAWELLHELVGEDGSFGRAYISLKNHEDACFGRPITIDVPIFNEWAVEDPNISSSVKSKRGDAVRCRPPYQVGSLALQMLYVPRPKGFKEEDMPKSMNSCVREMASAEKLSNSEFEGFLSQQGGDCPYWRRRFFKLSGSDLTAFHETTRQPRAKISLLKATKLIDDKTSLVKADGKPSKSGRRKSGFAEEDQAYMFVEEGFRIRFANGEAIDFYADSTAAKDQWMAALAAAVGNAAGDSSGSGSGSGGKVMRWCDVVLRRERLLQQCAEQAGQSLPRPRSQGNETARPRLPHAAASTGSANLTAMRSQPSSPVKTTTTTTATQHMLPVGLGIQGTVARGQAEIVHQAGPHPERLSSRRKQVRSMIF